MDIDPRRSLAAGAMWLIIALAITFSIAAAVWVGSIARANVIEQHVRRLALETDQLSSDFGQSLASRLGAVRAARILVGDAAVAGQDSGLAKVFDELQSAYPDLDWIALADADGVIVSANGALAQGSKFNSSPWFTAGLQGPWLGIITQTLPRMSGAALGDMAAPVRDKTGRVVGVIAAHLRLPRAPNHPQRLTDESNPPGATQAYAIGGDGVVLVGPDGVGKRWAGVALDQGQSAFERRFAQAAALHFERLPNGREVLVSRAPLSAGGGVSSLGWQVQLSEPKERVFQRADALGLRIFWVSLCLGAATAMLGTIGTRQLTRRLKRLTHSVASLGRNDAARIEVPPGLDEVSQLGAAFAGILDDLRQERRELKSLGSELERRVQVRTLEVERFAEEARYAAIVRERLKIARDLHDTLAHSMMAMLSEIRFLRKLQAHDPASVGAELEHAEEVAHEGLKEARFAITQMRVNAVREMGLGPALSTAFERFIDHTGLMGDFTAETAAARFGDERAETILRIANEVLRNVERHARATRVNVALKTVDGACLELRIEDNGVGFDPQALCPGHFGIVGLREQAEIIGAELLIESKPNEGTKVIVSLRLSPISFAQSA
ncbi:MAG TPA: histidine kinase [Steroidobacteraceae bacterium]|jgi:signal transduction histidine kinase|nr:histidine kinase [Steroidobacteraceae bacterium]